MSNFADPYFGGLDLTRQQTLAAAASELNALVESGAISQQESDFRLLIVQNQMTSPILEPEPGTDATLDVTLWHEGCPKEGREQEAIQQLWSGNFTSKIWCNRQSRIVIMKACYDWAGNNSSFRDRITTAVKACFAQVQNDFLGPIVEATTEFGFLASDLYPADLVWFYNPYRTLADLFHPQKAEENRYQGEEGSNVFYIGSGKILKTYPGDPPMTIEEKQEDMMRPRADWKSVQDMNQAYEAASNKQLFIDHLIQLANGSGIPEPYRPTESEIRTLFPIRRESFPIWNKRTPKNPADGEAEGIFPAA